MIEVDPALRDARRELARRKDEIRRFLTLYDMGLPITAYENLKDAYASMRDEPLGERTKHER